MRRAHEQTGAGRLRILLASGLQPNQEGTMSSSAVLTRARYECGANKQCSKTGMDPVAWQHVVNFALPTGAISIGVCHADYPLAFPGAGFVAWVCRSPRPFWCSCPLYKCVRQLTSSVFSKRSCSYLTLFRLSLNIASMPPHPVAWQRGPPPASRQRDRGIRGNSSVGGNYVVGFVLFSRTDRNSVSGGEPWSGADCRSDCAIHTGRAATGKQMAIDADLNAGMIDEGRARARDAEGLWLARQNFMEPWMVPRASTSATPMATILITAIKSLLGC